MPGTLDVILCVAAESVEAAGWTKDARILQMPRSERYPSDLTDAEWTFIDPQPTRTCLCSPALKSYSPGLPLPPGIMVSAGMSVSRDAINPPP